MQCVVIGAGIAGIAAAQGLRRAGAQVTLIERDPARRAGGYQLGIAPNGRYALDRLGLLDALDACGGGWPADTDVLLDGLSGRDVHARRILPDRGRYRAHTYFRDDVHAALLAGLLGEAPRYGHEVVRVVDDDRGPVRVECRGGHTLKADLVVVADGAQSRQRKALFGDGHAYRPCVAFVLAMAELGLEGEGPAERRFRDQARRHQFVQILMPGRVAILSMAAGARLGFGVGGPISEDPGDARGPQLRDFARRMAHGMRDPRIHHAIETACWDSGDPEHAPGLLRIGDIEPLPSYARGRVALVGDAAHAMLPVLGQGANQGLEDAMRLGERLEPLIDAGGEVKHGGVVAALRAWSDERVAHVTPIQRLARKILRGQLTGSRLRHRLACTLLRVLPDAPFRRQQNYVLKHAIADAGCPISRLDERWLRPGGLPPAEPSAARTPRA